MYTHHILLSTSYWITLFSIHVTVRFESLIGMISIRLKKYLIKIHRML